MVAGDFREHGIVGRNDRLERMVQKYIREVDILISEGTVLSRTEETNKNPIQTEDDLPDDIKPSRFPMNEFRSVFVIISFVSHCRQHQPILKLLTLSAVTEWKFFIPADTHMWKR